jgi:hypothetical protein
MPRNQKIVKLALVVVAAACVAGGAGADVVGMSDGRRFEGEILGEDAVSVTIDTRVSPTIRTTLRLDRSAIESIERSPLPPGFFDPPPVPPQVSDPQDQDPDDTHYLEVPITGDFGEDVFADGVRDVLRYAKRYRIRHIVFVVDCAGGDLDEVSATWDLLRNDRRTFTYHAVVRNCLGGALAIPIWCDSIFVMPGAELGGSPALPKAARDSGRAATDGIILSQMANDVVRQAQLEGPVALIVRAMIDHAHMLAGWRDNNGEIVVGADVPADLPSHRLIFDVDPGTALVLSYKQAVELGVESYDGDIGALGEVLRSAGWKRESDYGRRAMAESVVRHRADAEKAQAKFAEQVEENIRRRSILERNIEESMKRAAEWNPTQSSYDYYSRRWGWGWRRGGGRGSMTYDSRQRWQRRTDLSMGYLLQAAKTVTALERLDREAVKLGLEPTFQGSDLDWVKSDIQTKYNELMADRNRRG